MAQDRMVVNTIDEFCVSIENAVVDAGEQFDLLITVREAIAQSLLSMGKPEEGSNIVSAYMKRDFNVPMQELRRSIRQYDISYNHVTSWIHIANTSLGHTIHLFLCEKETKLGMVLYSYFDVEPEDRLVRNMTQVAMATLDNPEAIQFPKVILPLVKFLLEGELHESAHRDLH